MRIKSTGKILFATVATSAMLVGATTCASAQSKNPDAVAPEAAKNAMGDQGVKTRVIAALKAEKFSDVQHVEVSLENGAVILRGFVQSDWDRRHALEAARSAAGGLNVIDNIHMKEGAAR